MTDSHPWTPQPPLDIAEELTMECGPTGRLWSQPERKRSGGEHQLGPTGDKCPGQLKQLAQQVARVGGSHG